MLFQVQMQNVIVVKLTLIISYRGGQSVFSGAMGVPLCY